MTARMGARLGEARRFETRNGRTTFQFRSNPIALSSLVPRRGTRWGCDGAKMCVCTSSPTPMATRSTLEKTNQSSTRTEVLREDTSTLEPHTKAVNSHSTTTSMDELQCTSRRHDLAVAAQDVGWFPDRIDSATRRQLSSLSCQAHEVRISGLDRQYSRLEAAREELKRCVAKWFAHVGTDVILFRCLKRPLGWNNLKTKQGLFWEAGPKGQSQTRTVELERRGEQLLAGALKVSDTSFDFAWEHLTAMGDAFWVVSKVTTACAPTIEMVESLVDPLEGGRVIWIDYPKLVASCCKLGLSVLRGGCDGGAFVVGRGRDGGTFANVAMFGPLDAVETFAAHAKCVHGERR